MPFGKVKGKNIVVLISGHGVYAWHK